MYSKSDNENLLRRILQANIFEHDISKDARLKSYFNNSKIYIFFKYS